MRHPFFFGYLAYRWMRAQGRPHAPKPHPYRGVILILFIVTLPFWVGAFCIYYGAWLIWQLLKSGYDYERGH